MDTTPNRESGPSTHTSSSGEGVDGLVIERGANRTGRNLAMVLALGLVFLGVASLVKPDPRGANASINADGTNRGAGRNVTNTANTANTATSVLANLIAQPHPQGWKLIGAIHDSQYLVLVNSSPMGPRYSVFSHEGQLLQADMFADDVYRSFPSLDMSTLHLDPAGGQQPADGAIMLAEPIERQD